MARYRNENEPQWSDQKRPTVVRSKPANGRGPGLDSFSLSSLDPASLFSFSSSVVRISGCDRGVADGPAWRGPARCHRALCPSLPQGGWKQVPCLHHHDGGAHTIALVGR